MSFRDLPIRRKVTLSIVATTAVALLVMRVVFAYHEWDTSCDAMKQHFTFVANIVANDSAATFDFSKKDDAEKILGGLDDDPSFVSARLYKDSGEVFASHARSGDDKTLLEKPRADGAGFEGGFLHVFRPVKSGEDRVGTL